MHPFAGRTDPNNAPSPVTHVVECTTSHGVPLRLEFETEWPDREWLIQMVVLYSGETPAGWVRLRTITNERMRATYPTPVDWLRRHGMTEVDSLADLDEVCSRGFGSTRPKRQIASVVDCVPAARRMWEKARREMRERTSMSGFPCVDFAYVANGEDEGFPMDFRRQGVLQATYLVLAAEAASQGAGLLSPMSDGSMANPAWDKLEGLGYCVRRKVGPGGAYRMLDLRNLQPEQLDRFGLNHSPKPRRRAGI